MLPQTWEDPASKNDEAGGVFVSAFHLKKGDVRWWRLGRVGGGEGGGGWGRATLYGGVCC